MPVLNQALQISFTIKLISIKYYYCCMCFFIFRADCFMRVWKKIVCFHASPEQVHANEGKSGR